MVAHFLDGHRNRARSGTAQTANHNLVRPGHERNPHCLLDGLPAADI